MQDSPGGSVVALGSVPRVAPPRCVYLSSSQALNLSLFLDLTLPPAPEPCLEGGEQVSLVIRGTEARNKGLERGGRTLLKFIKQINV